MDLPHVSRPYLTNYCFSVVNMTAFYGTAFSSSVNIGLVYSKRHAHMLNTCNYIFTRNYASALIMLYVYGIHTHRHTNVHSYTCTQAHAHAYGGAYIGLHVRTCSYKLHAYINSW